MWRKERNYGLEDRNMGLKIYPLMGPIITPVEGVSHPLRNLLTNMKSMHGPSDLSNIPMHLKWCAFMWIEPCIFFYVYLLPLSFCMVSSLV